MRLKTLPKTRSTPPPAVSQNATSGVTSSPTAAIHNTIPSTISTNARKKVLLVGALNRIGFPPSIRSSGSSRAKPNQAGNFTTTFTGEVPGCQDEVTFAARAQGPDGELTTEPDADQSTVAIAIPMFEFKVTIDIEAGNDFLHSESTGLFF